IDEALFVAHREATTPDPPLFSIWSNNAELNVVLALRKPAKSLRYPRDIVRMDTGEKRIRILVKTFPPASPNSFISGICIEMLREMGVAQPNEIANGFDYLAKALFALGQLG